MDAKLFPIPPFEATFTLRIIEKHAPVATDLEYPFGAVEQVKREAEAKVRDPGNQLLRFGPDMYGTIAVIPRDSFGSYVVNMPNPVEITKQMQRYLNMVAARAAMTPSPTPASSKAPATADPGGTPEPGVGVRPAPAPPDSATTAPDTAPPGADVRPAPTRPEKDADVVALRPSAPKGDA